MWHSTSLQTKTHLMEMAEHVRTEKTVQPKSSKVCEVYITLRCWPHDITCVYNLLICDHSFVEMQEQWQRQLCILLNYPTLSGFHIYFSCPIRKHALCHTTLAKRLVLLYGI